MLSLARVSQNSHGTPQLSPQKQLAARLLAGGRSPTDVARRLGIGRVSIYRWLKDDEFTAAIEAMVHDHDAAIREFLLYGEEKAVETLFEVMDKAVDGKGKPDYRTRMEAAIQFLDRRGGRGKPVDQQEIKQLTLSGTTRDTAIAALSDPTLRAWLDEQPHLKAKLKDELMSQVEITGLEPIGAMQGLLAGAEAEPLTDDFEVVDEQRA